MNLPSSSTPLLYKIILFDAIYFPLSHFASNSILALFNSGDGYGAKWGMCTLTLFNIIHGRHCHWFFPLSVAELPQTVKLNLNNQSMQWNRRTMPWSPRRCRHFIPINNFRSKFWHVDEFTFNRPHDWFNGLARKRYHLALSTSISIWI